MEGDMDRTDEDRAALLTVSGSRYLWPTHVDWLKIGGLAERLRDETPPEWIARAKDVDTAGATWPDEGGEFVSYFIGSEDGPVEAVPPEVQFAMHEEMMEAKREAGWIVLTDYCRQLVPVIRSIERFGQ